MLDAWVEIQADLLSFSRATDQEADGMHPAEQLAVSTIDATREDLLHSIEARRLLRAQGRDLEPREAILNRCLSRLSKARADAFRARLCALIEEFAEADVDPGLADAGGGDGGRLESYALSIAFYARADFPEQGGGKGHDGEPHRGGETHRGEEANGDD